MKIIISKIENLYSTGLMAFVALCLGCASFEKLHNREEYANSGAISMIEDQKSVNGRLILTPPSELDRSKIFVELQSGEKIEPIWQELNHSMFIEMPMMGHMTTPYRDRKAWWKRVASKIDAAKTYSIELLTIDYEFPKNMHNFENEILRISDNGNVLYDSSICEIHKVLMRRILAKSNSAEDCTTSFFQIRKKNFPNDGMEYVACVGNGVRYPVWKCFICEQESIKHHNQ